MASPALVRILDWRIGDAYDVRDEVNVGELPLRADIVLIRRESGETTELARRDLGVLIAHMNQWTLIEFKSPTDSLEQGDVDKLLGVTQLFCAQQRERIPSAQLTVMILAPDVNEPFRQDLETRDYEIVEEDRGQYRIDGAVFPMRMFATNRLKGGGQLATRFFSRIGLRDPQSIIQELKAAGAEDLLYYTLQQIKQFEDAGETFQMQHAETEELATFRRSVLQGFPAEQLLEAIPLDQRLEGIPLDQRLEGVPIDEIVQYIENVKKLTAEQQKNLHDLLDEEDQE